MKTFDTQTGTLDQFLNAVENRIYELNSGIESSTFICASVNDSGHGTLDQFLNVVYDRINELNSGIQESTEICTC